MVNWHDEFKADYDKWSNLGRQAIESNCKHTTQATGKKTERDTNMHYSGWCEECGHSEDSANPMMNYAYPLEITPKDELILEVLENTNLTVMENTETGEYFLVLTGGGMDLSQDIALAYIILEKWIPYELAINVSTQKGLSVGGKSWDRLKKGMQESLKLYSDRAKDYLERWS